MAILRGLLLLALVALTACGGGEKPSGSADAREAIERFDSSARTLSGSLARLNAVVFTDTTATREAALESLDSDEPDHRLAAAYALGLAGTPEDVDVLAAAAKSPDLGASLLAATAALSLGDPAGVPLLIEALDDETSLPVSARSLPAWKQARFTLLSFTGQDFGFRAAQTQRAAAATKPAWARWWTSARDSFRIVRAPSRFLR